ncbi:hypothetical protein Tco_1199523 [Tanacetum coccineum]
MKKVIWYVLHNSPKIDMYRAKFKSEFPNKYMKEEFPGWFGSQIRHHYINKDPSVSESGELFALACGPTPSPISVNSCVVNCVRFFVHSRDERRTNQNSGICSPGEKDGELYYGQLEEILEFSYMLFKVVLFRVKWFDTSNEGCKIKRFVIRNNITQILAHGKAFKNDQYILVTQVKQCFYLEDMARRPQDVNHKKFLTRGVIVVENDDDVIHFDNSSDLALSTSLDDLDFATLNIDGQSMDVDAPPDIIDVDEDDDSIDDEEALPHDLADSYDEYLANDNDDDDVAVAAVAEARAPENPTVEVRKSTDSIPAGKPGTSSYRRLRMNWARRRSGLSGMLEARSCLSANYLGELVREFPLHHPFWRQVPPEQKAGVMAKIGAALKERYCIPDSDGTYDLERIRQTRPSHISEVDWDAQIAFWNDLKNLARAAQINKNGKEQVVC